MLSRTRSTLWCACSAALAVWALGGCNDVTFPSVAITTISSLPDGVRGRTYGVTLSATGGDGTAYTWSVMGGTLPVGLTLNVSGALSGVPAEADTSQFTVQVSSAGQTDSGTFHLTISNPPVVIAADPLPNGTRGDPYVDTLRATGGDDTAYSWSVTNGHVPTGLTLSPTGVLSGVPTEAAVRVFTVEVSSGDQTARDTLTVTISNPPVVVTTGLLPNGTRGVPYADTLRATGGDDTAYSWSVTNGQVPAGLTLSPTGALSGTPTEAGASVFTVEVTSGGQTARDTLSVTIVHPPVVITTASPLPDATRGVPYGDTLRARGGDDVAYSWNLTSGNVPTGLTLSTAGVLTGTPTEAGTNTFTVEAGSGGRTDSARIALTIRPLPTFILIVRTAGTGSGTVTGTVTSLGIASQWPPPGFACVLIYPWDCGMPVDSGSVVTLTARPNAGSVFAGWSGDCTTWIEPWLATSCQVIMDRERTVTATFNLVSPE